MKSSEKQIDSTVKTYVPENLLDKLSKNINKFVIPNNNNILLGVI